MKVSELKKGDKVSITHVRKGTFDMEVKSIDGSFVTGVLVNNNKLPEGLVTTWEKGEEIKIAKSLILHVDNIKS